ncbi:MAG: hypothetical protein MRY64_09725 [Hyphomonadaceae bacterium]|nr:hypothetical protein [Hyphomonadaceae bacterium]
MKQQILLIISAVTLVAAGCATTDPIVPVPSTLQQGLEDVGSGRPDCHPYGRLHEEYILQETFCAGFYPASLASTGVEANCLVRFNLLPGGAKEVLDVGCNVGRDPVSANQLGPLTKQDAAIAVEMFRLASYQAIQATTFTLNGPAALHGRENIVQPIDYSVGPDFSGLPTPQLVPFDLDGSTI